MKMIRTAAVALAIAVLPSACAGPGTEPGGPTPGSSSEPGGLVTNTPQPDPTSSAGGVSGARGGPTPRGTGGPSGPQVLTGTVTAGVEPGCILLDNYLLVGGPRDVLRPGARVVVTGQPQPGMVTTCQQGTPFLVAHARPA